MQRTCSRCGAWHTAWPDAHEWRQYDWSYSWTCRVCGAPSEMRDTQPPSYWSAGPEDGEPGTFPPWGRWWLDPGLIITIRDLAAQLVDIDDPDAIRRRESLLDHEGHHMAPWAGLIGDAADPTGVRHAIAYLRHGRLRRSGTRGDSADWAEEATLVTALIYAALPEMLEPVRERGTDLQLPDPVDVGPVIGWGEESLSARYDRRLGGAPLDRRIRIGEELLKDVAMSNTADSWSDYDSDLDHIARSARAWAQCVAAEQP